MSDYTAEIERSLTATRVFVVRVSYLPPREPGGLRPQRRKFLLVPDLGEPFESVAAKIEPAILAHSQNERTKR